MTTNVGLMQLGNAWWCDQHLGIHLGLLIGFDPAHQQHLHQLFLNTAPVVLPDDIAPLSET